MFKIKWTQLLHSILYYLVPLVTFPSCSRVCRKLMLIRDPSIIGKYKKKWYKKPQKIAKFIISQIAHLHNLNDCIDVEMTSRQIKKFEQSRIIPISPKSFFKLI